MPAGKWFLPRWSLLACLLFGSLSAFSLRPRLAARTRIQGTLLQATGMQQQLEGLVCEEKEKVDVDTQRPGWFQEVLETSGAEILRVKEWEDEEWRRQEGGFVGVDFCHSKQASVRIVDYAMLPALKAPSKTEEAFPRLVGIAMFSPRSESHRGLCHGGSFCALMDDAIGWLGFCVTGQLLPWSGYTVQVNTALKKSVAVGSVLRLESWVDRKEGQRKYWIGARLRDPLSQDVYCEGHGLFLLNPEHIPSSSSPEPSS